MLNNAVNIFKYKEKIQKFAKDNGYDGAKFSHLWNGYAVYKTYYKEDHFVGLPQDILVDKNDNMELAISNDVKSIINPTNDKENNVNKNYVNKEEMDKLDKELQNITDSKMVNTQIELWFKKTIEVMKDININDEYLSIPLLDIRDLNNIKLGSYIFAKESQNYYCQGYIEKDYKFYTLPKDYFYDSIEKVEVNDLSSSLIPQEHNDNYNNIDAKEKYFKLLDQIISKINNITKEDDELILEYLKLYSYLEKKEIQSYILKRYNPFLD